MSAPRAVVCYDEARPGMYLRIEGQDIASFMASAAWRAWLYYPASAVDGTDRDRILLDGGMGLRECQDMLEAIMEADGHGVEVAVDPSFGAFVNAGETYIRERSEVGLAIKAQTAEGIADDPQLGPRFREFRDVVNASMVRPLRDRQMLDAFFMATVGRAADFSVPGAGKTATVLGVFAYLRHLGLARRIVVVCPKNGFESWEKEWVATFGDKLPLSCFSLGDPAIAAMSTERRRNALSLSSCRVRMILASALGQDAYRTRSNVSSSGVASTSTISSGSGRGTPSSSLFVRQKKGARLSLRLAWRSASGARSSPGS